MPKLSAAMRKANKWRAERGARLMEVYAEFCADDPAEECAWSDLLADVLHAATDAGHDGERLTERALNHWREERAGR